MVFEEEGSGDEVPFSSYHSKSLYYQSDVSLLVLTLIPWLRECVSSFSTVKVLFFPVPYYTLWKGVTM